MVGNPRIIVLDEATASIDTHTEILIQNALKEVLKGRTSIVIAHRLSTIRNADRIVVLQGGRVMEVGKHEELLAKKGMYARLYAINYGLSTEGTPEAAGSNGVAVPAVGTTTDRSPDTLGIMVDPKSKGAPMTSERP